MAFFLTTFLITLVYSYVNFFYQNKRGLLKLLLNYANIQTTYESYVKIVE